MNNTTLNIISVHLFSTGLPLELIDITHPQELYKGLMARWALNAPPVTGPTSTQPGVYLKIAQPAWGWKQNYWVIAGSGNEVLSVLEPLLKYD